LSFLACIDCSELPDSSEIDWLPRSGFLLFFYDLKSQPWGFDPADRGGAATVYLSAADVSDVQTAALPPVPLRGDEVIKKAYVTFTLTKVAPSLENPAVEALHLNDDESDVYAELRESSYGKNPHHQIGGYADPIQNENMGEECQLVTHGIYLGGSSTQPDPRIDTLRDGAANWSLLFQMDSDNELDIMWGDAGMLYFWIRREDARKLDFSKTWLILQCG
jgi:uncharacterized protein YwqG